MSTEKTGSEAQKYAQRTISRMSAARLAPTSRGSAIMRGIAGAFDLTGYLGNKRIRKVRADVLEWHARQD